MANRATLHRNSIREFESFMHQCGFISVSIKGMWEVLRMQKGKRKLIIYDRGRGDHFTVRDQDTCFVWNFVNTRDRRENLKQIKGEAGDEK